MNSSFPTRAWLEKADGVKFPVAGNCPIGRSNFSHVMIADAKASRNHATIHAQDESEFWLIDLGSSNGTLLNRRRVVRPERLKDGDQITIASITLTFHQEERAAGPVTQEADATFVETRVEPRWLVVADIEGFTAMSHQLAPEELATLVGRWVKRGRDIIEEHDGAVNKYLGDGYLACWPSRTETLASLTGAVRAFRALSEEAELKFRLIVHHGVVSIGGTQTGSFGEESLLGPELNFIFRVEKFAAAIRAHFCFTAAAHALLASHLELKPIPGSHEINGFTGRFDFFTL